MTLHTTFVQDKVQKTFEGFQLEALRAYKCKQNAGRNMPPIPYKDVIQEAVDSSTNTLKSTLPHKVELCDIGQLYTLFRYTTSAYTGKL